MFWPWWGVRPISPGWWRNYFFNRMEIVAMAVRHGSKMGKAACDSFLWPSSRRFTYSGTRGVLPTPIGHGLLEGHNFNIFEAATVRGKVVEYVVGGGFVVISCCIFKTPHPRVLENTKYKGT